MIHQKIYAAALKSISNVLETFFSNRTREQPTGCRPWGVIHRRDGIRRREKNEFRLDSDKKLYAQFFAFTEITYCQ